METDLLFKLMFQDDAADDLDIVNSLYTTEDRISDMPPHPCEQFFARAAAEQQLAKGFDPTWLDEASVVEKRARTLGERLGVVRTEIRQEDGQRVVYAYNSKNEVVDVRAVRS